MSKNIHKKFMEGLKAEVKKKRLKEISPMLTAKAGVERMKRAAMTSGRPKTAGFHALTGMGHLGKAAGGFKAAGLQTGLLKNPSASSTPMFKPNAPKQIAGY
jgi:hypothetical protein